MATSFEIIEEKKFIEIHVCLSNSYSNGDGVELILLELKL